MSVKGVKITGEEFLDKLKPVLMSRTIRFTVQYAIVDSVPAHGFKSNIK